MWIAGITNYPTPTSSSFIIDKSACSGRSPWSFEHSNNRFCYMWHDGPGKLPVMVFSPFGTFGFEQGLLIDIDIQVCAWRADGRPLNGVRAEWLCAQEPMWGDFPVTELSLRHSDVVEGQALCAPHADDVRSTFMMSSPEVERHTRTHMSLGNHVLGWRLTILGFGGGV